MKWVGKARCSQVERANKSQSLLRTGPNVALEGLRDAMEASVACNSTVM